MANSMISLCTKLNMRLAMKFGVSLQMTTPLPSTSSAKHLHALDHGRVGVGCRNDLQQMKIAGRVEEVSAQEATA